MNKKDEYCGSDGILARSELKFKGSAKTPSDMVTLARAHYSALGTAVKRFKQGKIWYVSRVIHSRVRTINMANLAYDSGQHCLKAYDIDVLCAIWYQLNRQNHRAQEALILPAVQGNYAYHLQAFIIMHQIRFGVVDLSLYLIELLEGLAKMAESDGEMAQAGRVYRQLHDLLPELHPERVLFWERAIQLFMKTGATDQLEQMGVMS